jgi:hypothetical protein
MESHFIVHIPEHHLLHPGVVKQERNKLQQIMGLTYLLIQKTPLFQTPFIILELGSQDT